jgi:uncharacterized lipoprotein YddW (UPF0748 family)
VPDGRRAVVALALGASLLAACASDPASPDPGSGTPTMPGTPPTPTTPTTPTPAVDTPPTPPREFRGAWIATVANIDWPSRSGLSAAQQQTELRGLFRSLAQTNLNAAVLQIRPAADALYRSSLEPWSRYLTGTQGVDPGYDPLEFAVAEAHGAGLELHAWFNPFRAGNASDTTRFAATHVWRARRDLARVYGTQIWMDPGDPEVQDRTIAVILDVVRRYDIDAVHLDDYFYPYLERDAANRIIDFPDSATYARYNPRGLSRADWRRDNVDRFVERLYREVHAVKPAVRVGLSPFGIWRPGSPAGITGLDAYTEIYANSKRWLNEGWMDYFAPQLYWRIDPPQQSYTALLAWWASQNTRGRHLWPGNASYRVNDGTTSAFPVTEISNQVAATRAAGATGNVFYNTTSLLARGAEVSNQLRSTVYAAGGAVPPATPWLDATAPGQPAIAVTEAAAQPSGRVWTVRITPPEGEGVRWWVVQARVAGQWTAPVSIWGAQLAVDEVVPTTSNGGRLDAVAVRAADAVWNLGAPAIWRAPALVAAR